MSTEVLIIIALICIMPILVNLVFLYLSYRKTSPRDRTIEGFVRFIDNSNMPLFLLFFPVYSGVIMLAYILNVLTYPLQRWIMNVYEKIKHIKI